MQWTWLCMVIVLGCAPLCWSAEPLSPYIGQEKQEIKSNTERRSDVYLHFGTLNDAGPFAVFRAKQFRL